MVGVGQEYARILGFCRMLSAMSALCVAKQIANPPTKVLRCIDADKAFSSAL